MLFVWNSLNSVENEQKRNRKVRAYSAFYDKLCNFVGRKDRYDIYKCPDSETERKHERF